MPGEGDAEVRDIDDLVREFPTIVVDLGEVLEGQPQLRAMQHSYDAEVALRKTGTANRVELSRLATRLSADAGGQDVQAVGG